MTLTEFLLARLADDEEVASHADGGLLEHEDAYFTPVRILAECEAKRRIVEDHAHLSDMRKGVLWSHAEFVVRSLALPYQNHPDYREEWRV